VILVILVIYMIIPSLRDGHIYNVRVRLALPCFLYRSSGRVLPPLAARAFPELVVFVGHIITSSH
jgi:hypothetical protein